MPLRDAAPADALALAEVHVASWKAAYRGLMPDAFLDGLVPADRLDRWRKRFAEPGTRILVWEEQEWIAGFCFGGPSRDKDADPSHCGEINAIYLRPEAWGRGIGRALYEAAIDDFRDRGFEELTLWVLRGNRRARAFYERMGMAPDGAGKIKMMEPDIPLDEVRYRRSIG
jgi:GNAT superfamily N-acetyltransferase